MILGLVILAWCCGLGLGIFACKEWLAYRLSKELFMNIDSFDELIKILRVFINEGK